MVASPFQVAAWLAEDPVGKAPVGRTPHAVVHRQGKVSLRYFAPTSDSASGDGVAQRAPLFCVLPLINGWSVFDLLPEKSVVRSLQAAGVPVYLLDWGSAGPEDSTLPLSHFIDTVLPRGLDRACRHAGVATMDVLGYCVGGTVLAVAISRHAERVSRAFFLATPIDFHASGRLAQWARPDTFPVDAVVDGFHNFPRELMGESFRWLRPMGQVSKIRTLAKRFDDPSFRQLWAALERWNGDGVDFPGEAYREYIRRCYFDNALMDGGWMLDGRPVSLREARVPAVVLAASEDHIVPPTAAHALAQVWGGPVVTRTIRGGHVGVCAGRALPEAIVEWISA